MAYPPQGDPTNVMGRRILAYLVDLVLGAVIFAVIFLATATKITNVPADYCTSTQFADRAHPCVNVGTTAYEMDNKTTLLAIGIVLGYWVIVGMIEGAYGAFLGKRMAGLRVIGEDGGRAGVGKGALRGFMMLVDSMFVFGMIGLITASLTHPHRRTGDLVATTFVVGKESVGHALTASGASDPTEPHWDESRNAWIAWEPQREQWMEFDATTNEWRPM